MAVRPSLKGYGVLCCHLVSQAMGWYPKSVSVSNVSREIICLPEPGSTSSTSKHTLHAVSKTNGFSVGGKKKLRTNVISSIHYNKAKYTAGHSLSLNSCGCCWWCVCVCSCSFQAGTRWIRSWSSTGAQGSSTLDCTHTT